MKKYVPLFEEYITEISQKSIADARRAAINKYGNDADKMYPYMFDADNQETELDPNAEKINKKPTNVLGQVSGITISRELNPYNNGIWYNFSFINQKVGMYGIANDNGSFKQLFTQFKIEFDKVSDVFKNTLKENVNEIASLISRDLNSTLPEIYKNGGLKLDPPQIVMALLHPGRPLEVERRDKTVGGFFKDVFGK